MAVPYTFGSATSSIPLSQLDSNFATAITLGNTAVYLGNTTTTLNGLTLSNVTISSGNVTITSVTLTNANITGTTTLSGLTASTALALDASKNIVSVTNTGTGNNVLAASPSLTGTVTIATLNLTNALGTAYGGTGLTSYTANGVVYASSTSALTSGSALTFDGTSLGVGIASPTFADGKGIHINNATGSARLHLTSQTSGSAATDGSEFTVAGSDLYIINNEAAATIFYNAGSEQMRLTSTGLGIGTSSPAKKLVVQGSTADRTVEVIDNGSNDAAIMLQLSGVQEFTLGVDRTDNSFKISDSGALGTNDRLVLDSSGNLGLGVTPSASPTGSLFVKRNISGASTTPFILYYNSTLNASETADIYINSGYASRYYQNNGAHYWSTAPSGTAGNAITFTQAMTLDASGNLSVGTTSSGGKITAAVANNASFQTAASFTNSTNADFNIRIQTSVTDIGCSTSTPLTFSTANTERARIDSSGNLLVGTTALDGRFRVEIGATNWARTTNHTNGGTQYFDSFRYNGTQIGSIQGNNTLTTYNSTSDYRLKNVIGLVTGSGERIDALEPIEYEWKSNGSRTRGFLAHKFQEVYPQSVTGDKDAVDAEGNPVYQAMQASTAEVIADLVAEIKSLRKRLADAGL